VYPRNISSIWRRRKQSDNRYLLSQLRLQLRHQCVHLVGRFATDGPPPRRRLPRRPLFRRFVNLCVLGRSTDSGESFNIKKNQHVRYGSFYFRMGVTGKQVHPLDWNSTKIKTPTLCFQDLESVRLFTRACSSASTLNFLHKRIVIICLKQ
jgi:hypothetical protein